MTASPTGQRPELVFVVAVARNGVIGRDNQLPWRLKTDMQHFRRHTLGHPVLMGRKTWDSLGRPLPERRNLVISRQTEFDAPGAEVFADVGSALAAAGPVAQIAIIGGAQLYAQLLERVDRIELTEIHADIAGDTFLPVFPRSDFDEVRRESHHADADNEYDFDFVTLVRRRR